MSEKIDVNATKDEIMAFLKRTKVIKVSENRKRKTLKVLREELEAGGHFVGVVGKTGTQYKGKIGADALAEANKKRDEYQILTNQNPLGFNVKNTIQILGFKKAEDRPPPPSAAEIELSGYGGLPAKETASPPASSVDLPSEDYSKGLPVDQMRDFLSQNGVDWKGMNKRDLRQRYNEEKEKQQPPKEPPPQNPYAVAQLASEPGRQREEEEFEFPALSDPWGIVDDVFRFSESEEESEEEIVEERDTDDSDSDDEFAPSTMALRRAKGEIIAEGRRQREAEREEREKKEAAESTARQLKIYNDPSESTRARKFAARELGLPIPTDGKFAVEKERAERFAAERVAYLEDLSEDDVDEELPEQRWDYEGVEYVIFRGDLKSSQRYIQSQDVYIDGELEDDSSLYNKEGELVGKWDEDGGEDGDDFIKWENKKFEVEHETARD